MEGGGEERDPISAEGRNSKGNEQARGLRGEDRGSRRRYEMRGSHLC